MIKLMLTAMVIGVLFFLSACATSNEPPSMIYPDQKESPGNYPIRTL
jgi:hypothetical protein